MVRLFYWKPKIYKNEMCMDSDGMNMCVMSVVFIKHKQAERKKKDREIFVFTAVLIP